MADKGNYGESFFQGLCDQVDIAHNSAKIDRNGWDFYIEFPHDLSLGAGEIHSSNIECKVQVKTTSKAINHWDVKLSNLQKLATAPVPSFYAIINIDKNCVAKKLFLIHIDSNKIEKILERVHEEKQKGNLESLNSKKMRVQANQNEEVVHLHGECLKKQIESCIGSSYQDYLKWKLEFIENIGYEDGAGTFKFNMSTEGDIEKLLRMSLGYEETLDVDNSELYKQRFGIKENNSVISGPSQIQIQDVNPTVKGTIYFKKSNFDAGIHFPVDIYCPAIMNFVPEKHRSFRVNSDFFDIVFKPNAGNGNFTFNLDEHKKYDVRKLIDCFNVAKMVFSSNKETLISIKVIGSNDIGFTFKGNESGFECDEIIKALRSVSHIENFLDLSNYFNFSLSELMHQKEKLPLIKAFIDKESLFIRITDANDNCDFEEPDWKGAVFFQWLRLGDRIIGFFCVARLVNIKKLNSKEVYGEASCEVAERVIFDENNMMSNKEIAEKVKTIVYELPDDGVFATIGIEEDEASKES